MRKVWGSVVKMVTAWHCQSVSSPVCIEHLLVPNILEAGPQEALATFHVRSPSRAGRTHTLPFTSDFKPYKHPST